MPNNVQPSFLQINAELDYVLKTCLSVVDGPGLFAKSALAELAAFYPQLLTINGSVQPPHSFSNKFQGKLVQGRLRFPVSARPLS